MNTDTLSLFFQRTVLSSSSLFPDEYQVEASQENL